MQYSDTITGNTSLTQEQADELNVQLMTYKNMALYYHEGELGQKALEGWKYYYGELPAPITKGSSKWIDRSVWESVNGTLQELISVFTSGEDAVRFSPRDNKDALDAEAATKMINKVLLSDNDGYRVFHDAFKECCIVRNSWFKRYWSEGEEVVTETFKDLGEAEFQIYMATFPDEDIIAIDLEEETEIEDEERDGIDESDILNSNTTYTGTITYKRRFEGVKVEYVPFEQIIVEPAAWNLNDLNYIAHRVRKTKDELLEMGFCPEVVEELPITTEMLTDGVITNARVDNLIPINVSDNYNIGDSKTDRVWLYENYIRTSCLSGEMEILQVFTVNNQIIEVNRVNDIPFDTVTPFPIPGNVFGESVTDVTKDIQDLNTSLVRGIVDNVMNANFQRYMGVQGQYDARSLLENRPGGVVDIKMQGAIQPFPYHQLPNGVSQLLEYTETKKEARTGVTRLGQGLDPNVFKNDNAFATVNTMMTAAQNRLRMVARNIAENGMKKLMLSIYRLIRENGKMPITVETARGEVTLQPDQLPSRDKMIVSVAVGANERRERAQTLTGVLQAFESSQKLQKFMQPENAYYLGTQLLESMGVYDVQNYITPIDQLPEEKPDPATMLTLQKAQEDIKQTQATTQKILSEITEVMNKNSFEQQKAADEQFRLKEESLSKQDELADKMSIEERKLELERLKLLLEERKLELKRQEILIEAQLEERQERGVGLGNN